MIQMDLEQRQSARFSRPFEVTNNEDIAFSDPFEGNDVNLTGLSFWVDDADFFLPGQIVSLRIKNSDSEEIYCLEGVEVVHQRQVDNRVLCGCHITQVTSDQLLAHHRIVMTDQNTALISMQATDLSEFDFLEDGSQMSSDEADYQEASMALNLAVSQLKSSRHWGSELLKDIEDTLHCAQNSMVDASEIERLLQQFSHYYQHMSDTTIALGMLAKLLAHTPNNPDDKQAWQRLIADFESRFLTEQQQIAYDFMHQGMSAEEALQLAERYLNESFQQ
ncbi:PilZ domain-containing protein [Thiomicrorhabdus sediminis]|uniref:PilZ domain-containing protein n=1 Tax=Thiomicrorhabdus sediminis TaxID=2580412 RepID=A0A4P9K6G6_9GAMM|nr:PilZ domain-containing protein [Thiomicrorhabdus sediminis]QCU89837.1 PilZ domain-containing protein [Thiomicrorhabdus sediminis]